MARDLTTAMRKLLDYARVCRVGSTGAKGTNVAPFCPAFDGDRTLYIETQPTRVTVRNLADSAEVIVLVDDYVEDWSRLWMLSIDGTARTLSEGAEFDKATALLRKKFPQFEATGLEVHFVLAIDITGVRHAQGIEPAA